MSDGIAPLATNAFIATAEPSASSPPTLPVSNVANSIDMPSLSAATAASSSSTTAAVPPIATEIDIFNPSSSRVCGYGTGLEIIKAYFHLNIDPRRVPHIYARSNAEPLAVTSLVTADSHFADVIKVAKSFVTPCVVIGELRAEIKQRFKTTSLDHERRGEYMKIRIIAAENFKQLAMVQQALAEIDRGTCNPRIAEIKLATWADLEKCFEPLMVSGPDLSFLYQNIPSFGDIAAEGLPVSGEGFIDQYKFPGPFKTANYSSLVTHIVAPRSNFKPDAKHICAAGSDFGMVMTAFDHPDGENVPLMMEPVDETGKRALLNTILLDADGSVFDCPQNHARHKTAGRSESPSGVRGLATVVVGEGIGPLTNPAWLRDYKRALAFASIKVRIIAFPDKQSLIRASEWLAERNKSLDDKKKFTIKVCSWQDLKNSKGCGWYNHAKPDIRDLISYSLTPEQVIDLHQRGII